MRASPSSAIDGSAETGSRGIAAVELGGNAAAGDNGIAVALNGGVAKVSAGTGGVLIYCPPLLIDQGPVVGVIGETLDIDGQVLLPKMPYSVDPAADKFVRWTLPG